MFKYFSILSAILNINQNIKNIQKKFRR